MLKRCINSLYPCATLSRCLVADNDLVVRAFACRRTNKTKNSEYFSDTLTSSFETKMTSVLTGAKTKLENNMTQYAEKMGDNKSEAVRQTLTRMRNNISVLENYLSEKSMENGLMNALNSNSSLTQYLINKNNGTL